MADNVTRGTGSEVVSTEEVTTLNGATVSAQHVQRTLNSYRTADGTVVDGVGIAHRLDATNDAVTNYPYGHSATYISTATTTTIKTGAGVLQSIVITETAAGTVTIYDNTAGSGTTIGVLKASIAEGSYLFNVAFTTGLTIVTAGASKITVTYR